MSFYPVFKHLKKHSTVITVVDSTTAAVLGAIPKPTDSAACASTLIIVYFFFLFFWGEIFLFVPHKLPSHDIVPVGNAAERYMVWQGFSPECKQSPWARELPPFSARLNLIPTKPCRWALFPGWDANKFSFSYLGAFRLLFYRMENCLRLGLIVKVK